MLPRQPFRPFVPQTTYTLKKNSYINKIIDEQLIKDLFGIILGGSYIDIKEFIERNNINLYNIRDEEFNSPLHRLIDLDVNKINKIERFRICNYLINKNANLNGLNKMDTAPLHLASQNQLPDIVELLVNSKADVNIKNNLNQNALVYAIKPYINQCPLVEPESIIPKTNTKTRNISEISNSLLKKINDDTIKEIKDIIDKTEKYMKNYTEANNEEDIISKYKKQYLEKAEKIALTRETTLADKILKLKETIKEMKTQIYNDIEKFYKFGIDKNLIYMDQNEKKNKIKEVFELINKNYDDNLIDLKNQFIEINKNINKLQTKIEIDSDTYNFNDETIDQLIQNKYNFKQIYESFKDINLRTIKYVYSLNLIFIKERINIERSKFTEIDKIIKTAENINKIINEIIKLINLFGLTVINNKEIYDNLQKYKITTIFNKQLKKIPIINFFEIPDKYDDSIYDHIENNLLNYDLQFIDIKDNDIDDISNGYFSIKAIPDEYYKYIDIITNKKRQIIDKLLNDKNLIVDKFINLIHIDEKDKELFIKKVIFKEANNIISDYIDKLYEYESSVILQDISKILPKYTFEVKLKEEPKIKELNTFINNNFYVYKSPEDNKKKSLQIYYRPDYFKGDNMIINNFMCLFNDATIIDKLRGISINNQDLMGNTALHYAVENRNIKMIKKLLDKKASIIIKNKNNKTPLEYAIELEIEHNILFDEFIKYYNIEILNMFQTNETFKKNIPSNMNKIINLLIDKFNNEFNYKNTRIDFSDYKNINEIKQKIKGVIKGVIKELDGRFTLEKRYDEKNKVMNKISNCIIYCLEEIIEKDFFDYIKKEYKYEETNKLKISEQMVKFALNIGEENIEYKTFNQIITDLEGLKIDENVIEYYKTLFEKTIELLINIINNYIKFIYNKYNEISNIMLILDKKKYK